MKTSRQAFTLIEIVVATTILAVVMVSVFEIYLSVLTLSRRLEFSRSLQENARSMTEVFAKEIRDRGIDLSFYDAGSSERILDYQNGNAVLAIRPDSEGNFSRYYLMEDSVSGPVACREGESTAGTGSNLLSELVGCYLGRESLAPDGTSSRIRLTDSRVKVENLRFHIVGISAESVATSSVNAASNREAKVTAAFDLAIPPGKGLDPKMLDGLKIRAQTTISEKVYKSY